MTKEIIRAHLNEMPFNLPFSLRFKIALKLLFTNYNRYPDLNYSKLVGDISELENVSKEEVLAGAGSSALIALLMLYFNSLPRQIVLEDPSFAYYKDFSQSFNIPAEILNIYTDGSVDYSLSKFENYKDDAVIFLTSPNNPTGLCIPIGLIEELLMKYPSRTYVIDAAYLDFTNESYLSLFKKYKNLTILKTLSKGSLSAAIRVGYLLAPEPIVKILKTKLTPWSISELSYVTSDLVLQNILRKGYFSKQISYVSNERNIMIQQLMKINWVKIEPNQNANSVFFEILDKEKASKFMKITKENNFLIKVFENFNGNTAIRYTVCLKSINQKLLKLIKKNKIIWKVHKLEMADLVN